MQHNSYSIYDSKAGAYLPPFILPSDAVAVRVFGDCVNDPDHQFAKHPEDYTLFKVADFDDVTGIFTPLETKLPLGLGVELVQQSINTITSTED